MTAEFGGKLQISSGFLLLLAWLNYLDNQGLMIPALMACAFHEMGHYYAILHCGGAVDRLSLTIVGAELVIHHPLSYEKEFFTSICGPVANLIVALIFCRVPWGEVFAGLNVALALLNLLPVGKLDGGRALQSLLSLYFPLEISDFCCRFLDFSCSWGLFLAGFWLFISGGSITLFLLGFWLILNQQRR